MSAQSKLGLTIGFAGKLFLDTVWNGLFIKHDFVKFVNFATSALIEIKY